VCVTGSSQPSLYDPWGSVHITKRGVCQRAFRHSDLWCLHVLNKRAQRALDLVNRAGSIGAGPDGGHQTSGNHGRVSRGRASACSALLRCGLCARGGWWSDKATTADMHDVIEERKRRSHSTAETLQVQPPPQGWKVHPAPRPWEGGADWYTQCADIVCLCWRTSLYAR